MKVCCIKGKTFGEVRDKACEMSVPLDGFICMYSNSNKTEMYYEVDDDNSCNDPTVEEGVTLPEQSSYGKDTRCFLMFENEIVVTHGGAPTADITARMAWSHACSEVDGLYIFACAVGDEKGSSKDFMDLFELIRYLTDGSVNICVCNNESRRSKVLRELVRDLNLTLHTKGWRKIEHTNVNDKALCPFCTECSEGMACNCTQDLWVTQ